MTINEIYVLLLVLIFVPAMIAQFRVRAALKKYSQVRAHSGRTGAEAAAEIMADAGIHDVQIERTDTIHERRPSRCRPTFMTVNLSPLWALPRMKRGMPFSISTPTHHYRHGWPSFP
jgi:Zn-dependent membrane protease YugP